MLLTEIELRQAFYATNTSEPLAEGWPGLERFAREVERLVKQKLDSMPKVAISDLIPDYPKHQDVKTLTEQDPNGLSPHVPGAKLDATKPNCDLVFGGFSNALLEVAKVGTFGARKYTDNGWKQVPNGVSRYRSAAYRHLLSNDFLDSDSSLPHLAQAAWNCLAALELILATKYETHTQV